MSSVRALASLLAALAATGCVSFSLFGDDATDEPDPTGGTPSSDGASGPGGPGPASAPGPASDGTAGGAPTGGAKDGNGTAGTSPEPAPEAETPGPAPDPLPSPQAPTPTGPAPPSPSPGGGSRGNAVLASFEAGADAAPGRYVERFALAPGGASFTASLRGVPEARVHLSSLFLLRNDGNVPLRVRLVVEGGGAPAGVDEARLTLRAPGGDEATLDLRAPQATLDLDLPARGWREASWTLTLGSDAASPFTWGLRLEAVS